VVNRSPGAKLAGLILTGIAGVGFFITSYISIFNETYLRFAVPGLLILTGFILVSGQWLKRADSSEREAVNTVS
jgi:hypothetical protein